MTPESLGYLLHRLLHAGVKTAMRTRYPMRASGIVVLVAAGLAGGCLPDFHFEMPAIPAIPLKSLESLVDEKHAVSDPEIVGKWVSYAGLDRFAPYLVEVKVEIKALENVPNKYAVTSAVTSGWSGGKSESPAAMRWDVGRWDKLEFADVESSSAGQARDPILAHSFWRIQHDGDFLWLAYMDSDWAEKHIPEEKWRKSESWSDPLVFIGSTQELQALVLSPVYDRNEWIEFCFVREGALPSSVQSLKLGYMRSGDLYEKEKRYEEAVVALQRYVELDGQGPDGHTKLAVALLGSNNPEQARDEFDEATRRGGCLQRHNEAYEWCKATNQGERHFSVGVTYFAGDQYKQASREFHKALSFVSESWEEPFLWDFLALRGSGKEGDARKLLKQAAKKPNDFFSKSAVADYFRGKISGEELAEASKKKNTPCEAYFVLGSEALIAGDKAAARQSFEKAARENDCSPLMAAATSARLKQLGAK